MKISLITPARKQARTGNRTTAMRWARILRDLGHRVQVATDYVDEPADLMIALHAWRSAASVRAFRARYPDRPLIVGMAGTDIYRFQQSDPDTTHGSMALADRLVGLHDLVAEALPEMMRGKLRVIYQSVPPLPRRLPVLRDAFEVLVIGHLREEKDPLRAALAARGVPAEIAHSRSSILAWRMTRTGPRRRATKWCAIRAIDGAARCPPGWCGAPWRARRSWC